jgi:hypothetical protein
MLLLHGMALLRSLDKSMFCFKINYPFVIIHTIRQIKPQSKSFGGMERKKKKHFIIAEINGEEKKLINRF